MMFTAVLTICAPILANECVEIVDVNVYDTHSECVERAVQMFHSTQLILPPPYSKVFYECDSKFKKA